MVDILQKQTRNYTPDMSSANFVASGAQEMKDWSDAFKQIGSISDSIGREQAKSKELAAKQQKEAEQAQKLAQTEQENADRTMIDTQIGNRAQTDLMRWNAQRIMAGVDPNTDAYTQALYAKRDEIYQPYIEQMTTEKGRNVLQKQALDTGERLRQSNIGKIAQNRRKAQAQVAFAQTGAQLKNDAYGFGQLGDWDGFQEATKSQKDAMIKYAKKNGGDAAAAETEFTLDYNGLVNYLGGLSQSEPELVVNMLDKEGAEHERLKGIIPEKVLERYTDGYLKMLQTQKQQLQERLKSVPAGSKAHDSVKKQIKELDDKISNPDEDVFGLIREALAGVILPDAKKNLEKEKLAAKELEEKYQVKTFLATISPDSQERFNARAQVDGPISRLTSYFKGLSEDEETKGPFAKLKKAYNDMKDATKDVMKADPEMPMNNEVKYQVSEAAALALNRALADGDMPDIERLSNGLEAIAELKKTPGITEQQMEQFQNILHAGLNDKIFGGITSDILQGGNRYFPDTSWLSNVSNPISYKSNMQLTMMGMPSKDIEDTDVDTVKNYLQANAIRITDTAINMLDQVAALPTTEARQAGAQQVANWVASEKEKVYNTAMKNYGIDLERLREEKRKTGRAFTQIGFQVKEYMGDTPDGQPIFETNMSSDMASAVRKRIMEGLEASKTKGEK